MIDTDSQKRNWLGTVVFTDIVGYSKCAVDQQIEIKDHFNQLIAGSIVNSDESERVILDTGDGIALCFLGDPEEAIVASMDLRAEVAGRSQSAPIPYEVRTGINLGPVRLVTDINGRFNVLGDGINVAQRVMSFAGPNQVLVSRAFYDIAWCLSDNYSSLFRYYGVRKDKHSREHVLYEIISGQAAGFVEQAEVAAPAIEEYTRIIRSRLANDTAPLTEADWDQEVLRQIENDLMEYIGPLAKVVVRKEAARAMSIEDLQVRIAKSIPAGANRQDYMKKIAGRVEAATQLTTNKTIPLDNDPLPAAMVESRNQNVVGELKSWPPEMLEGVQQQFATFVGPLAAMLVRKASRRAKDTQDLYRILANEIDDPNDRDGFLRNLAKKKDF